MSGDIGARLQQAKKDLLIAYANEDREVYLRSLENLRSVAKEKGPNALAAVNRIAKVLEKVSAKESAPLDKQPPSPLR